MKERRREGRKEGREGVKKEGGGGSVYKTATQGILAVMEMFYILTVCMLIS